MEKFSKFKMALDRNKILVLIIFLSFVASLAYSFYFQIKPRVDARAYDVIALNLANGNGYRENLEVDILSDYAVARVGPLYEYMLAGFYKVFGHYYEPVWIFHALLHALTVLLVYRICLLVFKTNAGKIKIGLLASAIIGFYPDLIEISAMLMIETLYLFLMCLMLYLFFRILEMDAVDKGFARSSIHIIVLGIVSGLAVLARPPILLFIPIILFYFYQKKKIIPIFILLFFISLIFLPWTVRNYKVYGTFMPLGVAGTYNLWIGNHQGASGEQEQPQEALDFIATNPIQELSGESVRRTKDFLFSQPGEFIQLTFSRANKYFSIIRPMGFWFYQTGWSQFLFLISSALGSLILFVLGLAGAIKAAKLKKDSLNYFLAFLISTPLLIIVTVVETRYRFQIYPLLAVFAGFFIVYWLDKKRWRPDKIFWWALLIVGFNGLVDLVLSLDKFTERLGWFL